MNIEGFGADDTYYRIFEDVSNRGSLYGPRNKQCIEVRPMSFTLISPEMGIYTGISRRLNYAFWAVETLCYIAGINDKSHAYLLCAVNKNIGFGLNKDTNVFDGSYCNAFRVGLPRIYEELNADPDSRRAAMSIWNNAQNMNSKDIPCTMSLHFYFDKNKDCKNDMLSMSVYMRSNDINWGLPYDMGAFCSIQVAMANVLGLNVGTYHHNVGSMHYYLDGNSDGEKPPKIAGPDIENWIVDNDKLGIIKIPVPPIGVSIYDIILGAERLLMHLIYHLDAGGKANNFVYVPTENILSTYFSEWAAIVAWTWKAGGL